MGETRTPAALVPHIAPVMYFFANGSNRPFRGPFVSLDPPLSNARKGAKKMVPPTPGRWAPTNFSPAAWAVEQKGAVPPGGGGALDILGNRAEQWGVLS